MAAICSLNSICCGYVLLGTAYKHYVITFIWGMFHRFPVSKLCINQLFVHKSNNIYKIVLLFRIKHNYGKVSINICNKRRLAESADKWAWLLGRERQCRELSLCSDLVRCACTVLLSRCLSQNVTKCSLRRLLRKLLIQIETTDDNDDIDFLTTINNYPDCDDEHSFHDNIDTVHNNIK